MRRRAVNQRSLLKFTTVFLAAYLSLLALSINFGQRYVELLLPIYRWEISLLTPDYQILSLRLEDNHGEAVVALNLQQTRYIVVEGHPISPGGTFSSSTLAGHTLQHALLMLSLLAAWPIRCYAGRLLMLASAVPFLVLIGMLDTPLMLLGSIDDLILANIAPDSGSILVGWMHLLDGGGRMALPIAAALISIACATILSNRSKRHSTHP